MKVLWLCKQHYMNHDVIQDKYGRLFEIPDLLSETCEVWGVCFSYRFKKSNNLNSKGSSVRWLSWSAAPLGGGVFFWIAGLVGLVRRVKPSVIVASSDCVHIIVGSWISRLFGVPFYADLYDNYESFGLAKIPCIKPLYRKALASSSGIVVVSETLGELIRESYPEIAILVLESTIDKSKFSPQIDTKPSLGIPLPKGVLVGVGGGLNSGHDIETLYKAVLKMSETDPQIFLIVAGVVGDVPLPQSPHIHYIGAIPHNKMALFYSTLDVAVIPMSNSDFGYYAFPQKAYEIIACKSPVVAANVGSVGRLFMNNSRCCYEPSNIDDLIRALLLQLKSKDILDVAIPSWKDQVNKLLVFISTDKN